MLKIHSKPDRNQSKLTVCSGHPELPCEEKLKFEPVVLVVLGFVDMCHLLLK